MDTLTNRLEEVLKDMIKKKISALAAGVYQQETPTDVAGNEAAHAAGNGAPNATAILDC